LKYQDIILSLISILFGYSLIPQVFYGFRTKKGLITIQTGVITSAGMYVAAIVYFTLEFYLVTVLSFFTGTWWLLLLVQRLKYGKIE